MLPDPGVYAPSTPGITYQHYLCTCSTLHIPMHPIPTQFSGSLVHPFQKALYDILLTIITCLNNGIGGIIIYVLIVLSSKQL